MTTYKEIFGKYVQNYSSDPTSTDTEGQIYYNTTSGTFKTVLGNFGAWASGGSLITARESLAGAGTQTAGLAIGGYTTTGVANTEEYDGTIWAAGGNLTTARRLLGGCGTQTVALGFGGLSTAPLTSSESFNGFVIFPFSSIIYFTFTNVFPSLKLPHSGVVPERYSKYTKFTAGFPTFDVLPYEMSPSVYSLN